MNRLRSTKPLPRQLALGQAARRWALPCQGDELNQLYVSVGARGTGKAAGLLANAEARRRANDFKQAWLVCAIGTERAARFYENTRKM